MKKLFAILLAIFLLAGLACATSVDMIRGSVYLPVAQTNTALTTGIAVLWSDSTYVAPYVNRTFYLYNKAATAVVVAGTIEASMDNTVWCTVDASSLVGLAKDKLVAKVIQGNSMPYWRIRGSAATTAGGTTVEARVSYCTN